jgi:hypothetical protein
LQRHIVNQHLTSVSHFDCSSREKRDDECIWSWKDEAWEVLRDSVRLSLMITFYSGMECCSL